MKWTLEDASLPLLCIARAACVFSRTNRRGRPVIIYCELLHKMRAVYFKLPYIGVFNVTKKLIKLIKLIKPFKNLAAITLQLSPCFKLSRVDPGQFLDGRPPGEHDGCC